MRALVLVENKIYGTYFYWTDLFYCLVLENTESSVAWSMLA